MGVFSLEFIGFFKSRICFEREFYIFAAGHCGFGGLLNLGRIVTDFRGALGFFVIQGPFFNEN